MALILQDRVKFIVHTQYRRLLSLIYQIVYQIVAYIFTHYSVKRFILVCHKDTIIQRKRNGKKLFIVRAQ